jgi:geranylgeranyl pyrophosphate synthase
MRSLPLAFSWDAVPPMRDLVTDQLRRTGKRLRPITVFAFCQTFGGSLARTVEAASAIEIYHTATLVYDDVQDNSEFRRGLPCAHVSSSTSTALNLAGTVRSLMFRPVNASHELSDAEKLSVHERLERASTLVGLGQSIDIGWHEGWYASFGLFPYMQMIKWKTGALFACAAAFGAELAHAHRDDINASYAMGEGIGTLFQMADDYLDVFGNPGEVGHPPYEDVRGGKLTAATLPLLEILAESGEKAALAQALDALNSRSTGSGPQRVIADLMARFNVEAAARSRIGEYQKAVRQSLNALPEGSRQHVEALVDCIARS